jgi:hypothetical protein
MKTQLFLEFPCGFWKNAFGTTSTKLVEQLDRMTPILEDMEINLLEVVHKYVIIL